MLLGRDLFRLPLSVLMFDFIPFLGVVAEINQTVTIVNRDVQHPARGEP